MKKLGKGWQYTAYDLGTGRVLKRPYSTAARFLTIFWQSGSFSLKVARQEMARVDEDGRRAINFLKDHPQTDLGLLGNPVFHEDSYEQDKVQVFKDAWKRATKEGKRELIEKYVRFIPSTWAYGFADKIFNFSINNGITPDGRMIQLDFGELSLSKEEVADDIKNKRWLESYSYLSLLPLEMRRFYRELMEREITSEKLDELWNIRSV